MMPLHPYIKYAAALIMAENDLNSSYDITTEQIKNKIEEGLDSFRIKPISTINGKNKVDFGFCREEKGNTKSGIFLSPNIITTDKLAGNTWKAASNLIDELQHSQLNKIHDFTMSVSPIAGEYLSFSLNNIIGRGKPKATLFERGLSIITTLTKEKPCLQYRINKKGQPDMFNVCLIPDMPIDELKDFILFFKRILISKTTSDLMIGNVKSKEEGKQKKITYLPKRPLIFSGNFPNPPSSSALGSIALLGTIGEFAKETEYSEQAKRVLENLKYTEIYLIKYGDAKTFTYNHYVIDLAKEGKLKTIVDSLYYSQLYKGKRFGKKDSTFDTVSEYQKFDLFISRFLQLFNSASFKDFLSFRTTYPYEITILLTTYFIKMEKVDSKIVKSAQILGKWLNKVAYFAAKNEVKEDTINYWEEVRKVKSKVLVELESSTFSSKSGDALIAQAVTRAGRLSGMDAPEGTTLFMRKTASGELPLNTAKNLLIAFSRVKSEKTDKNDVEVENGTIQDEEDLSNI